MRYTAAAGRSLPLPDRDPLREEIMEIYGLPEWLRAKWRAGWRDDIPSITCPVCGMTSYNENDIEEGFCGSCCAWTTPR